MERDYQKDLEVCDLFNSSKVDLVCGLISRDFIDLARTALPWYVKRCISLQSQLQQAQKQKSNVLESYRQLKDISDRLGAIVQAINDKENDQYWAWQPDFEKNHLESLSCPVLIPAAWLRELLEEKDTQFQQAEAHNAALRQALKYEVMYHGKNCTCRACQAISSYDQANGGGE